MENCYYNMLTAYKSAATVLASRKQKRKSTARRTASWTWRMCDGNHTKKCKPIVAETWDQLRGFVQKLFSFTFALVPLSAAAIRVAQFGVKNFLK